MQVNCREIARLYGGEATYNAIENFLRKPKAKAKQLKAEAEGREGPVASPARPRAPKTTKATTATKVNGMYPGGGMVRVKSKWLLMQNRCQDGPCRED